ATMNECVFPEALDLKTVGAIIDKDPGNNKNLEDAFTFGVKINQALLFIQQRQAEGEWHYQGKGVKLDDAVKVICAWKKSGDAKYRAVFGDLRIRAVAGEAFAGPSGR